MLRWYPCCPCCGKPWQQIGQAICQDHIIPISRGGINTVSNLQPLCQSCNLWKSDKLIYFTPAFPGQPSPLPERLHSCFASLSCYQLSDEKPDQQLSLFAADQDPELLYPFASSIKMEQATIHLTWEAIHRNKDLQKDIRAD